MLDWSVLQWLDAGQTPLMILMAYLLFRVERRVLQIEVDFRVIKVLSEKGISVK